MRNKAPGLAGGLVTVLVLAPSIMTGQTQPNDPLRPVAERYVKLVLAVGQHDGDVVDAFYGPAEWRKEAEGRKIPLPELDQQAAAIEQDLQKASAFDSAQGRPAKSEAELWALRRQYLTRQLSAIRAKLAMLQGKTLTFDEESRALYDAVAPTNSEASFDAALKQLDASLRGSGILIERYTISRRRSSFRRRGSIACSRKPFAAAASGRCCMWTCLPKSVLRLSTSPTSHGPATTGIRETTAA
jgi:hypothetical protein